MYSDLLSWQTLFSALLLGQGTDTPLLPRVELAERTRADFKVVFANVTLLFATGPGAPGAPVVLPRLSSLRNFSAFSLMVGSPEMGGMEKVSFIITLCYMTSYI